jgi:FkbM family methyltransferase
MNLKILYGVENNYTDVTSKFFSYALNLQKQIKTNEISIPKGDWSRAEIFGDPVQGKVKNIIVKYDNIITITVGHDAEIKIDISNAKLDELDLTNKKEWYKTEGLSVNNKLELIHSNLLFSFGDIKREYPEQLLSVEFINPEDKVLELGGNIGRNSLVIATILNNFKNLVVLETNKEDYLKLNKNMTKNGYNFYIENAALSKRSLIQKGWNTIPSEEILDGYFKVNTITFEELELKYNIKFNTLVADCEGALYYIFLDSPNILNGFKKLIIENDYPNNEQRMAVEKIILEYGFKKEKQRRGGHGGPYRSDSFLEVWKK